MIIQTAQIGELKVIKDPQVMAMDITVKSAMWPMAKELAPTWDMVMSYKSGEIDEAEYRKQYIALLQQRYLEHKTFWLDWVRRYQDSTIVLGCYCKCGAFCHRLIAAEVLLKVANHIGIEATIEPEG
jgi:uncharacterized protein YeaO (DUF488 family)